MKKTLTSTAAVLLAASLALASAAPASAAEGDSQLVDPTATVEVLNVDAPVDETPTDETPVDETPVEDVEPPVDETPIDETPAENPEDGENEGGDSGEEVVYPAGVTISSVSVGTNQAIISVVANDPDEVADSYGLQLTGEGTSRQIPVTALGNVTLTDLVPGVQYSVAFTSTIGNQNATNFFSFTTEEAPVTAPTISDIVLGADSAIVTFSRGANSGAVTHYELTVEGPTAVEPITVVNAGAVTIPGLASGLYGFTVKAFNNLGSASTSNYFFVIPEVLSAPSVTVNTLGQDYASLRILRGPVENPIPTQEGPTAVSPVNYRIELSNGETTRELTLPGNLTILNIEELVADTTYTARVFAVNAAGDSPAGTVTFTTEAKPVTPVEPVIPVAPNPDTLTNENKGDVSGPSEVKPGGVVVVDINGVPGNTVNGWLFSEPTALGAAIVDANGRVSFTIPANVPAGAHRLAITDTNNNVIGWLPLTVLGAAVDNGGSNGGSNGAGAGTGTAGTGNVASAGGAASADELARTGGNSPLGLALLGTIALAGGAFLVFARRKAAAQS